MHLAVSIGWRFVRSFIHSFLALIVRFITRRFIGEYDPNLEKVYSFTTIMDNEAVLFEILDAKSGQLNVRTSFLIKTICLFNTLFHAIFTHVMFVCLFSSCFAFEHKFFSVCCRRRWRRHFCAFVLRQNKWFFSYIFNGDSFFSFMWLWIGERQCKSWVKHPMGRRFYSNVFSNW